MFVTTRLSPDVREGQDFLLECLLTDPSIQNLTLQSEDSAGGWGSLPQGMNVTFDPRKGALIRDLQRSFNGRYVCSGWKDGRQYRSTPVDLLVVPSKTSLSVHLSASPPVYLLIYWPYHLSVYLSAGLRHPPSLSITQDAVVRLEGEKFEVTCVTSNPSHFYTVTWTHPNIQVRGQTLPVCVCV